VTEVGFQPLLTELGLVVVIGSEYWQDLFAVLLLRVSLFLVLMHALLECLLHQRRGDVRDHDHQCQNLQHC
jgi:hypothetical protein